MNDFLQRVMLSAVSRSVAHVEGGGIPFVGVVVRAGEVISGFCVNRVHETGDASAHAEVVAIRDALAATGGSTLRGSVLLATGEPCGMCYRYALNAQIADIRVAVDREQVASFGFDYRSSYPAFGIDDALRGVLMSPLRVTGSLEPFTRFVALHASRN